MIKQTSTGREVDIAFPRRGSFTYWRYTLSHTHFAIVSRILLHRPNFTTFPIGAAFRAINRNPSHFTTFTYHFATTPSWHTLFPSLLALLFFPSEKEEEEKRQQQTTRARARRFIHSVKIFSGKCITQRNVTYRNNAQTPDCRREKPR